MQWWLLVVVLCCFWKNMTVNNEEEEFLISQIQIFVETNKQRGQEVRRMRIRRLSVVVS